MTAPAAAARSSSGSLRRRWRRFLVRPLAFIGLAALAWFGGFVWFATTMPVAVEEPLQPTDAVVVLTGGRQRVETGLALLAEGKAKKLFVSGVHHGVNLTELMRLSPELPAWISCCIVLGYAADSTAANAAETAEWMEREGFRSLRLVTAAYHMRRGLLEFRRAMPEIEIIPYPVFPETVKAEWWAWPGTATLVANEYDKYLGALLRGVLPFVPERWREK